MLTQLVSQTEMEMDSGYSMKIALITEEQIILKMLSSFLSDLGHKIKTFNSISKFLCDECEFTNPSDAILVDLNMSTKENIQAVRDIHSRFPKSLQIIMSAVLPAEEAIRNGVFAYYDSPANLGKLELILTRLSEYKQDVVSQTVRIEAMRRNE